MIKKFTIYGERCSGTNYIQKLMGLNFKTKLTWKFGWKHFFGFQDELLQNSDEVLFICIIRDVKKWLNSLYRERWHIAKPLTKSVNNYLNDEFYSHNYYDNKWSHQKSNVIGITKTNSEILEDRNIYTKRRYKNIFELRHTKLEWMLEDLPNKVKNVIFIKYEDLITDFESTMQKIMQKGLIVKDKIEFPLNTKKGPNKKKDLISDELILSNPNLNPYHEKKLGYI